MVIKLRIAVRSGGWGKVSVYLLGKGMKEVLGVMHVFYILIWLVVIIVQLLNSV